MGMTFPNFLNRLTMKEVLYSQRKKFEGLLLRRFLNYRVLHLQLAFLLAHRFMNANVENRRPALTIYSVAARKSSFSTLEATLRALGGRLK